MVHLPPSGAAERRCPCVAIAGRQAATGLSSRVHLSDRPQARRETCRRPAVTVRLLVDAFDVGRNAKGVQRVIVNVLQELVDLAPHQVWVATTKAGRAAMPELPPERVKVVPTTAAS